MVDARSSIPNGDHHPNGEHPPNGDHHHYAGQQSETGLEAEGSERSAAEDCPCLPSLGEGRHCACVADHGLVGPCSCPEGAQVRQREKGGSPFGGKPHAGAGYKHAQDRGQVGENRGGDWAVCPAPAALLHSDADRREFISAGAAAGLAVRPDACRSKPFHSGNPLSEIEDFLLPAMDLKG